MQACKKIKPVQQQSPKLAFLLLGVLDCKQYMQWVLGRLLHLEVWTLTKTCALSSDHCHVHCVYKKEDCVNFLCFYGVQPHLQSSAETLMAIAEVLLAQVNLS
jgi:hypothetical protein